jgi:hypothetical protein
MALLCFLGSCANWKQKDFVDDLNRPSHDVTEVPVASDIKDEKLLEKFEVLPIYKFEHKEQSPLPKIIKAEDKKTFPQKVKEKEATKVKSNILDTKPLNTSKKLPPHYPKLLSDMSEKAKKVWNLYRPNHPIDQKVYLDIHYLGMTVGKILVVNKGRKMINNKEVWHFHARFKSAPFYSHIYELDDTVDTYVTTDQFLTSRYSLIQRETKMDIDDLQLHDRDQFKTFWFYHQKKSDGSIKDKKVESSIPYFSLDPFSVLFFYQGLPLKNGDQYEIPLINKGKILILKSFVEARETIDTEKGKRRAIRIHATTKYSGETLKSGDMYLWFSDDNNRTLLKAKAKINIGSVTADIVN